MDDRSRPVRGSRCKPSTLRVWRALLAAQAGCVEAGDTRQVGKGASVVGGGQAGAGPSFRCPCRWRGCDSSSGQRLHWGRSRSPPGRWTRCLQMAVVAALWGMGPPPGPRSLWVRWGEQGPGWRTRRLCLVIFSRCPDPTHLPGVSPYSIRPTGPALSPLPFQAGEVDGGWGGPWEEVPWSLYPKRPMAAGETGMCWPRVGVSFTQCWPVGQNVCVWGEGELS